MARVWSDYLVAWNTLQEYWRHRRSLNNEEGWRIGSKLFYSLDQRAVITQEVIGSQELYGHQCWVIGWKFEDTFFFYTWQDKDTMGRWASYSVSSEITQLWQPEPGVKILPIGDRSYDTKVYAVKGDQFVEAEVSFKITNRGLEKITVPAGPFSAYHLVIEQVTRHEDRTTTQILNYWYSTEIGGNVKEIYEKPGVSTSTYDMISFVI